MHTRATKQDQPARMASSLHFAAVLAPRSYHSPLTLSLTCLRHFSAALALLLRLGGTRFAGLALAGHGGVDGRPPGHELLVQLLGLLRLLLSQVDLLAQVVL